MISEGPGQLHSEQKSNTRQVGAARAEFSRTLDASRHFLPNGTSLCALDLHEAGTPNSCRAQGPGGYLD